LVGQALFIPSLCEGLPVRFCRSYIAPDSQECLSYSTTRPNAKFFDRRITGENV
jgi:hypothetical protein